MYIFYETLIKRCYQSKATETKLFITFPNGKKMETETTWPMPLKLSCYELIHRKFIHYEFHQENIITSQYTLICSFFRES